MFLSARLTFRLLSVMAAGMVRNQDMSPCQLETKRCSSLVAYILHLTWKFVIFCRYVRIYHHFLVLYLFCRLCRPIFYLVSIRFRPCWQKHLLKQKLGETNTYYLTTIFVHFLCYLCFYISTIFSLEQACPKSGPGQMWPTVNFHPARSLS